LVSTGLNRPTDSRVDGVLQPTIIATHPSRILSENDTATLCEETGLKQAVSPASLSNRDINSRIQSHSRRHPPPLGADCKSPKQACANFTPICMIAPARDQRRPARAGIVISIETAAVVVGNLLSDICLKVALDSPNLDPQLTMSKRYVSNKDESVRLFKNDLLEKFTHVHWSVPILIYVPASLYFFNRPSDAALLPKMLFLLGGLLAWTLTEYVLHRFVFHYQPSSSWGRKLHFLAHGVHHDYPNDSTRLVMPPTVSIPLATLFYALFYAVIPAGLLPAFYAGFLFGYVCYDTLLYATHHAPMKGKLGHWLKHHHLRHHYLDDECGFGVSTPLWDYVFGTQYERTDKSLNQGG